MRKGIIFSATLHAGIIGATLVAWPHAIAESPEEMLPAIPVDLVPADLTRQPLLLDD